MEKDIFNDLYEKFMNICDANNLVGEFRTDGYPIVLTVRPDTDMDSQISMLEDEVGHNGKDSRVRFIFVDGRLIVKVQKDFTLSDALFGKLKNLAKKMHYAWLCGYFRERMEQNRLVELTDGQRQDEAGDEQAAAEAAVEEAFPTEEIDEEGEAAAPDIEPEDAE